MGCVSLEDEGISGIQNDWNHLGTEKVAIPDHAEIRLTEGYVSMIVLIFVVLPPNSHRVKTFYMHIV